MTAETLARDSFRVRTAAQSHSGITIRGLNPLELASEIKIPMMIYHGDCDQTVPLIQSDLFVERAKKSNKTVEYHVLKDYAHGPAWTRQTAGTQLTLIRDYFKSGCGGAGL